MVYLDLLAAGLSFTSALCIAVLAYYTVKTIRAETTALMKSRRTTRIQAHDR